MEDPLLDDEMNFKQTFVQKSSPSTATRDTESYYELSPFLSPKKLTTVDWVHRLVPITQWLPKYRPRQSLLYDTVSGLVVGVLMVPQSMAYALLAGLPAEYGLYSCVVPALVYAIFGTCRQLSVGPVSIQCLLIAAAAGSLHLHSDNDDDDGKYIRMALTMSILIGIFQIFLGVFRLGVITNFLSKPVLSGFTSGAGFIIAVSQLKYFIGADIDTNGKETYTILFNVCSALPQTNLNALFIGLTSLIFLFLVKKLNFYLKELDKADEDDGINVTAINQHSITSKDEDEISLSAHAAIHLTSVVDSSDHDDLVKGRNGSNKKLKYASSSFFSNYSIQSRKNLLMLSNFGPMYVVVFASIISYILVVEFNKGFDLVGHVHKYFKAPDVPDFLSWSEIKTILPFVITAGLMSFVESFAIATKISSQLGYDVNPSQELTAIGLSNFFGSFFNAMPIAGSFTRSAVNFDTGAQSLISGIFAALFILISLFVLTPLFYYIPMSALGAIVEIVAVHLINFDDFSKTFNTSKTDSFAIVFTFLATALFGVEVGIVSGVFVSIGIVTVKLAFPKMTLLGQVIGHDAYRSVERYQDIVQFSGIAIVHMESPLFFANSNLFRRRIQNIARGQEAFDNHTIRVIVLDCSNWNNLDMTVLSTIEELVDSMNHAHMTPIDDDCDGSNVTSLSGYDNYIRGMKIIFFAQLSPTVMKKLRKANVIAKISEVAIFLTLHEAVIEAKSLVSKLDAEYFKIFKREDLIDAKSRVIDIMPSPTFSDFNN